MITTRRIVVKVVAGAALASAVAVGWPGSTTWAQGAGLKYEVDVTWPKPFPDRWVIGGLGGLCVDAQDHVFILNRQDVLEGDLNAGHLAPSIIEIDPAGSVVNSWGDAKLIAPRLHRCYFAKAQHV